MYVGRLWATSAGAGDGHMMIAVARKLAVIMHRMWVDGAVFRWSADTAEAA